MSTATPTRKPATAAASTTTPTAPSGGLRKPASQQTTPGRSTSPAKPTGTSSSSSSSQVLSGVARSPSTRVAAGQSNTRPARAGTRRTGSVAGGSGQSAADLAKEEDSKAENAAIIDGLKESVRTAEHASEDYQKQLTQTQQRVDELLREHAKMEERLQEALEKNEELQLEKKEATRELREAGNIYESEKAAMLKDREDSAIREEELRATIQSLKDKIIGRDAKTDEERAGRPPTRDEPTENEAQFAPSATISALSPQRSDSKSTSRLVMQKDQLIESLRLELAEAQIKLVEMENQGGGRMAELEKTLLETRMTNARLMEDNESYQLLLGEKTMNGEIAKSSMLQHAHSSSGSGMGSLAEELESAENNDDKVQRLQERVRTMEDQNKALTLYIDKMLTKIMTTADQMALLDKDGSPDKPVDAPHASNESQGVAQGMMAGLSRSLSVFNKRQRPSSMLSTFSAHTAASDDSHQHPPATSRSRPVSGILAPAPNPDARLSAVNNPLTAPSIPLGRSTSVQMRNRGHRRTQSSQSAISAGAGESAGGLTISTAGPTPALQRQLSGSRSPGFPNLATSPGLPSGPSTPRFAPSIGTRAPSSSGNTAATSSIAEEGSQATTTESLSSQRMSGGSGASFTSNENLGVDAASGKDAAAGGASPPRNSSSSGGPPGSASGQQGQQQTNYTGAVMTQNKLRPLRLVQQEKEAQEAEEAARKKSNRASWMGWFNRGAEGAGGQPGAGGPGAAAGGGGPGGHPQTIDEQTMS